MPTLPESPKMQDVIDPLIQKIVAGHRSARDGLDQAADGREEMLADAGYYEQ